jgi:hypothetical protein
VLLAFYYQLQEPYQAKSLDNLLDIFSLDQTNINTAKVHLNNYLTFHTLLSLNANERFLAYMRSDRKQLREYAARLKHFNVNAES